MASSDVFGGVAAGTLAVDLLPRALRTADDVTAAPELLAPVVLPVPPADDGCGVAGPLTAAAAGPDDDAAAPGEELAAVAVPAPAAAAT